jgi:hypothetical protein
MLHGDLLARILGFLDRVVFGRVLALVCREWNSTKVVYPLLKLKARDSLRVFKTKIVGSQLQHLVLVGHDGELQALCSELSVLKSLVVLEIHLAVVEVTACCLDLSSLPIKDFRLYSKDRASRLLPCFALHWNVRFLKLKDWNILASVAEFVARYALNLEKLDLGQCFVRYSTLVHLTSSLPCLHSLSLPYSSDFDESVPRREMKLTELDCCSIYFGNICVLQWSGLVDTLQTICYQLEITYKLASLLSKFHSLQSFRRIRGALITEDADFDESCSLFSLRELVLERSTISKKQFALLFGNCQGMQRLVLTGCSNVTVENTGSMFPHLKIS